MKSQTAKQNPVLMDKAIAHYLKSDRGTKTPLFTFMSLFDDNEPYPLPELLTLLDERISGQEQAFNAGGKFSDELSLATLRNKRAKLLKEAKRMGA